MLKVILRELKHHAPFTGFGALTGVLLMFAFQKIPSGVSYKIFYTLHPAHVLLSAIVTASLFCLYQKNKTKSIRNFLLVLAVGYLGSVGIATLSDSLIPFWGEKILHMPHSEAHIGFIEEWWIVNPLAVIGVGIAYFWPTTKLPHAGHVLISTWASLFHMVMAGGEVFFWYLYPAIFIFLFIAVWAPCCLSDIIFPLFFVKGDKKEQERLMSCSCGKKHH